jgi:hypothetical protein
LRNLSFPFCASSPTAPKTAPITLLGLIRQKVDKPLDRHELFGVFDAALKNRQHRFAVLLAVLLFALLILGHPDPLPVSGNAASEDTRA